MRTVYFIKEKKTDTWCYSSKHQSFSSEFEVAAVFLQKENAEKAIKSMLIGIDPKRCQCPSWYANSQRYSIDESNLDDYTKLLVPEFEIVAFNLIQT